MRCRHSRFGLSLLSLAGAALLFAPQFSEGIPDDQDKPQEAPEARAFRALGELGLEAKADAREKIIRQIVVGLEQEEAKLEKEGAGAEQAGRPNDASRRLYLVRDAARTALVKIGTHAQDTLPLYGEALKSKSPTIRASAALVIGKRGMAAKELLSRVFKEASAECVVDFYRTVLPTPWGFSPFEKDDVPDPAQARQIARSFAKEHPEPKVRAVSLSFCILLGRSGNDFQFDLPFLNEIFSSDADLIVRRAAIRIAGAIGYCPGTIDLKRVILEEKDALLLQDAVGARSAWSERGFGLGPGVELWDGLLCDWLPGKSKLGPDWDEEEVAALFRILNDEAKSNLRDAASMALSERHRGWGRYLTSGQSKAPQPRKASSLKVHEWGVFLDAGKTLIPPERVISDLPPFVHRSEVGAQELWAARSYSPSVVTKPVLFFYTPEPLCLLVQVHFFEGRPWTFYPRATDYDESTTIVRYSMSPAGTSVRRNVGGLKDRQGISPDWLKSSPAPPPRPSFIFDRAGETPEKLRQFYRVASWLRPNHPEQATRSGQGPIVFTGMGIEWCGLRVGYPDPLEGESQAVPEGSWWHHLRDVPSNTVAVRGERERFLFYDGAANVPPPVLATWKDASKSTLVLRTRSFGSYPPVGKEVLEKWLGTYRESDTVRESEEYPDAAPLPAVFVVSKPDGDSCHGAIMEGLGSQAGPVEAPLDRLELTENDLRERLMKTLITQGLTVPEANALLLTWEKEFFQASGLRVITVLPRWFYDAMLPLEIDPVPGEVRRVGLVLKECRELEVEAAATTAASRWEPRPIKILKSSVEVRESSFSPGNSVPLVLKPDGTVPSLPGQAFPDRLSSNGKNIVFCREREPVALHLGDTETRTTRLIIELQGKDHLPGMDYAISGDGKRLFLEVEDTIRVFDFTQGKVLEAPKTRHCSEIVVSHDGRRAAWSDNESEKGEKVSVLDLARRELCVIEILDSRSALNGRLCGGRLAFSMDGKNLACVAAQNGQDDIFLIDLEAETIIDVSMDPAIDTSPCLAQGGRLVLFESGRDRRRSIYVADVEAKTLQWVAEDGRGARPLITEDGLFVFYTYDGALWRKDLRTGESKRILASDTENIQVRGFSREGDRALVEWLERSTRRTKAHLVEIR